MVFQDRSDAGEKLAAILLPFKNNNQTIVLGLPRGGVITAYEVAHKLNLPLDIIIARKIGAPNNPEFAIGAIIEDGTIMIDQDIISVYNISQEYLNLELKNNKQEIERRVKLYRKNKAPLDLKDKTVIIVDDGIATGLTVLAAIQSVKKRQAKCVIVATPVAAQDSLEKIKKLVDKVFCLHAPFYFGAVGAFYNNFEQVSNEEVVELLRNI